MKLWLLKRINEATRYDEYFGHVVRAPNEIVARALCPHGDEGAEFWSDPEKTLCTELPVSGDMCVILSDFNAG